MKKIFVLFILILCLIGIHGVTANYTHLIEEEIETTVSYSDGTYTYSAGSYSLNSLYIDEITDYRHVTEFQYNPGGNYDIKYFYSIPKSDTTKAIHIDNAGVTATGTAYIYNDGTDSEYLVYVFDSWDIGTATGHVTLDVRSTEHGLFYAYANVGSVLVKTGADPLGPRVGPIGLFQTTSSTEYKGLLTINSTQYENYVVSNVSLNRYVDGTNYPSWLEVLEGAFVYLENTYGTSGIESIEVQTYPIDVTVSFGYPTIDYSYKVSYYADGNFTEQTPAITPTPTPIPEMCGFWSLTVNNSNIKMNQYVLGSLNEIDPQDRFDMIDWFIVTPNGQEFLMKHYIYDPGLFGLGAGWFEVTQAGNIYASSAAEAKENTIQFTTAGKNHLRVKIYDDFSLVPLIYHDYNLICSPEQVVYVAETTQATSQLGINLYESDTNAMVGGAEIHTHDKNSGEWQNKTSTYGGTVYFNVVPGNTYRILIDDSRWITYDQDYTVPSPPGILPIYLKRPLVEVENASYIHFYVKDASTYTAVMNAGITLSDGQAANTLSTGYAGFNVTDNALIYYTVSKTGYNSLTGSFQITEDTTETVYLYPKVVTTIPTTVPYWTQTPTPLATYPNGTVIPGQTTQSTPYQTLNTQARAAALTEATDPWYRNASLISNLLLLALIMGIFTLMTSGIGGRRRKR